MAALRAAKKELRKAIKQKLAAVSASSISSQSDQAVKSLFSMPEYQSAYRIGVYLSMPNGEITTAAIVHDAFRQGKEVFVPYIHDVEVQTPSQPKAVMDMLSLQSEDDYRSLGSDSWGIPTLSEESITRRLNCFGGREADDVEPARTGKNDVGLDLLVMPGMAFDSKMARLGHGKGFYDYFLQRYQEKSSIMRRPTPFLVGLALKEQLLSESESVPSGDTDWHLDALVTGDGTILRARQP